MATAYTRPKSAKEFFSLEKFNKGGDNYKSPLDHTIDKTEWTTQTYLLYNDVYFDTEIICSGSVVLIDSQVAILMEDTSEGATGRFMVEFDQILMPLNPAESPVVGDILYWDATNERLTITPTSNTKCAVVLEAKAAFITGNTERMPVGTFIKVRKTFS